MIFIDDSIKEDVEILKVILHELIHQKFIVPSAAVLADSVPAAKFHDIVQEVEVERQARALMKKLT
jgi:predicted aminopeptidase